VYVEGRLQIREYEDKDHNPRTSVEIVASRVRFLGGPPSSGDEKQPTPGPPRNGAATNAAPSADSRLDDHVPF
jgi:single-stranded DNA-binding protein